MADYTDAEFRSALNALPLERGDVVFIHSNIGFFGRLAGVSGSDQACARIANAVLERIGPNGTLVVPTFTYSFPRGELFDVQDSASGMGTFAEWVRKHPDSMRSADPCYSVAAIGARACELTDSVSENSFGEGSFFARFGAADGKILNFNFDAGSTFVHYVERCLAVPYRFDKTFSGTIRDQGSDHPARSTIWVRYLSDDSLIAAFEGFAALALAKGVFRVRTVGRGQMGVISAADTRSLIAETLPRRPWFLTRAEALGVVDPVIEPE